jgi:hypothetical protein
VELEGYCAWRVVRALQIRHNLSEKADTRFTGTMRSVITDPVIKI